MQISQICTHAVVSCRRGASAAEVARLMREQHVGDVIVVDSVDGQTLPVGIVTDRDLVVQVLAAGVDPELITASDLMSEQPTTALGSEGIYDAVWHMRGKGIRRLPIVDARGALVGVLTADDVTRFLASELNAVAQISTRQIRNEREARNP